MHPLAPQFTHRSPPPSLPRSHRHPRRLSCTAFSTATNNNTNNNVTFTVHYRCAFGHSLKVVGASPELGAWDPFSTNAAMQWNEGDVWTTTISLPPGQHDFKLVVDNGEGRINWEWGDNKFICLPEDSFAITMEADCNWGCPEFNLVSKSRSSSSEVETVDMAIVAEEEEEEEEIITTHVVETKEEEAPAFFSLLTAAAVMENMPEVVEEEKAAVVAMALPIIEETKTPEAATPVVPTFESTPVRRHVSTETSSPSPPPAAPASSPQMNVRTTLTPFDSFSSDGQTTPTPPINPMAAALATSAVALAGLAFFQLGHISPISPSSSSPPLSLLYNKSIPIITASINNVLSTTKATPASFIFSSSSTSTPSSLETVVVPPRRTSEMNTNTNINSKASDTTLPSSLVGYNMTGMYKDLVVLKKTLYQLE